MTKAASRSGPARDAGEPSARRAEPVARTRGMSSPRRMTLSATSMANVTAFAMKDQPVPTRTMRNPPRAGPIKLPC